MEKIFYDELGTLANASFHSEPIKLANVKTDKLLDFYKMILKIRLVEEKIADLSFEGEIKTPVHLAIGQEAIAVAVSANLTKDDKIYSCHRSHAHFLATGAPIQGLLSEVMGKSDGVSRGMGGSMHLFEPNFGFNGSVPIVGATIPIAVGAALACKMDGNETVAIAYFGDGACEEGVLHESLNLAQTLNLPVVFVCENNLYSSHMDIDLRQPSNKVSRFAEAHKVNSAVVDGNDVVEMEVVSSNAISRARNGGGPSFIEAVTYRWRGHVGPNIDIDVGIKRSVDELTAWKKRDPLMRLKESLKINRAVEDVVFSQIDEAISIEISDALKRSRSTPYPDHSAILDFVYDGL
jgi:pyruvate dehydrogenase E1 component alpha subunit